MLPCGRVPGAYSHHQQRIWPGVDRPQAPITPAKLPLVPGVLALFLRLTCLFRQRIYLTEFIESPWLVLISFAQASLFLLLPLSFL
jgi:hypothetical protein